MNQKLYDAAEALMALRNAYLELASKHDFHFPERPRNEVVKAADAALERVYDVARVDDFGAMPVIQNVRITSTSLGDLDRGMTGFLDLQGDGWGCSWGGLSLKSNGGGIEWISKVLDTVGVRKWEDLAGRVVRVKMRNSRETPFAIGHIVEEKWFNPSTDLGPGEEAA